MGLARDASQLKHRAVRGWSDARLAEATPRLFWQVPGVDARQAMIADTAPASEAVEVYVNEDRWVAACPDCGGAQLAARQDKRFLCNECGNVAVGGRWRPVVWPAQARAIEAVLDKRPEAVNRNWLPGQTVADLQRENEAHGIED